MEFNIQNYETLIISSDIITDLRLLEKLPKLKEENISNNRI